MSLFSGGLDSLIGAIDLLEAGATPLLVSRIATATSDAQGKLFAVLKKHYNTSSFERLRVGMTFDDGLVEGVGSENSTSVRQPPLGVFAGTGLGKAFVLRVPEKWVDRVERSPGPITPGFKQHSHYAPLLHGSLE